MKKVVCLSVIMLFFGTAYAEDCKRPGNVFEELYCARKVFFELDDELNKNYNLLLAELDKDGKALLKKEQIAWIKDRNTSCTRKSKNGAGSVIISCAVTMTRERLLFLKEKRHRIFLSKQSSVSLSEDHQFNSFLKKIQDALELHSWKEIIKSADPVHYQDYIRGRDNYYGEFESSFEIVYIAYIFNLPTSSVEKIKYVHFQKIEQRSENYFVVEGITALADKTILKLQTEVIYKNGSYWLTGAVG